MKSPSRTQRPLLWIASSRKDYAGFPAALQESLGFELFLAQLGEHPPSAKPLKGQGAGVLELVGDHRGDTYRTVYLARFAHAVYVLHCFKKKSKSGIKTPRAELDLIRQRLRVAEADYQRRAARE